MKLAKNIIIFLAIFGLAIPTIVKAQTYEPTRQELENVLSKFINYRFGTISILRVKNPSDVKRALKTKSSISAGKKEAEDLMKTIDPNVAVIIQRGVDAGNDCDKIREDILNAGLVPPEQATYEKICQGLKSGATELGGLENAYLITTRPKSKNDIPSTIIALLTSDRAGDNLERNLRSKSTGDIYTYDEMKAFKLDTSFTADNLYDLMVNTIMQNNIENKTLEAQGLGNKEWFTKRVFGKSLSLINSESDVTPQDVQKFLRISDGQALDYNIKENEITLSPDLISWKKYTAPVYEDNTGAIKLDSTGTSNLNLPEFGLELRYGIDNISYPSFWSERLSVSALWQSVKLGIILPTDGWSSLSKDLFNVDRRFTHAGVGLNGSFDFPFKVIPSSGVFHIDFGYVFGDAKPAPYKKRVIDPETFSENMLDFDNLIRANVQIHYTFGLSVDENYWFRFGIGGTVYTAEKWYNKLFIDQNDVRSVKFVKLASETVGGISGKIEFLSRNIQTPFGGSLQYFDEALGATIWLQIPIVEHTFALRLDAKGYFTAFKDKPRDWENSSVFIPMARFIINL